MEPHGPCVLQGWVKIPPSRPCPAVLCSRGQEMEMETPGLWHKPSLDAERFLPGCPSTLSPEGPSLCTCLPLGRASSPLWSLPPGRLLKHQLPPLGEMLQRARAKQLRRPASPTWPARPSPPLPPPLPMVPGPQDATPSPHPTPAPLPSLSRHVHPREEDLHDTRREKRAGESPGVPTQLSGTILVGQKGQAGGWGHAAQAHLLLPCRIAAPVP